MNASELISNAGTIWSILVGLSGFLSGIFWSIWRTSKYIALNDERIGKLTSVVTTIANAVHSYASEFAALRVVIQEREKDIIKLEGISDATRRDLMETTKTLERTVSKIEALWFTLQKIHPEHIPKRASDRS